MSGTEPKGSTGKPFGEWGNQWGSQWGCGTVDFRDVCQLYNWKQLEFADNYNLLCQIIVRIAQAIEATTSALQESAGIDNAHGLELDQWGEMLDERREGASDDLFRRLIKGKARKLYGSGTPDDFFDVVEAIQPNPGLTVLEAFPACVRVFFRNLNTEEQRIVFGLMNDVPALTICLQWIEVDPGGVFEFSHLDSPPGVNPRVLFPIDRHWGHTDGDIPQNQTAGKAFLVV